MKTKKPRRGRPPKIDLAKIRKLGAAGYKTSVIAERCGCSARYVQGILRNRYWYTRLITGVSITELGRLAAVPQ
mgnify:CR=1 FL=1